MRLPTDKVFHHNYQPYISFVSTYEAIRVVCQTTDLGLKESVNTVHKFVHDNGIITGMYLHEIEGDNHVYD